MDSRPIQTDHNIDPVVLRDIDMGSVSGAVLQNTRRR